MEGDREAQHERWKDRQRGETDTVQGRRETDTDRQTEKDVEICKGRDEKTGRQLQKYSVKVTERQGD